MKILDPTTHQLVHVRDLRALLTKLPEHFAVRRLDGAWFGWNSFDNVSMTLDESPAPVRDAVRTHDLFERLRATAIDVVQAGLVPNWSAAEVRGVLESAHTSDTSNTHDLRRAVEALYDVGLPAAAIAFAVALDEGQQAAVEETWGIEFVSTRSMADASRDQ